VAGCAEVKIEKFCTTLQLSLATALIIAMIKQTFTCRLLHKPTRVYVRQ